MDKKWFLSKTLWVNAFLFVAAVAANFGFIGELPADWEVFVLPAVAGINLLLRFITKVPVTL